MKPVMAFTLGATHPSSRLRIAAYAGPLARRGWRLQLHHFDSGMGKALPPDAPWWRRAARRWLRARQSARAAAALRELPPREPVIVSRELPVRREPFLDAPNPLVLDIDDALYLGRGRSRLEELCRRADVVVCGNRSIAGELSACARCVVIPTVADTDRLRPRTSYGLNGPLRVGWLGSSMSIDETLSPLMNVLAEIQGRPVFELVVISDRFPRFLRNVPWARFVPWSPAAEESLGGQMDVGLMPLADDAFQRAKCGAKLAQYMAAGLPVIATPIGVNRELVCDGVNGFWAATPREWRHALQRLADDEALRAAFGRAGRERAVRDFSVEGWADAWVALLDELAA